VAKSIDGRVGVAGGTEGVGGAGKNRFVYLPKQGNKNRLKRVNKEKLLLLLPLAWH